MWKRGEKSTGVQWAGFREEGMEEERGQHKKRQQDEPTGGSEARGQQRALDMPY